MIKEENDGFSGNGLHIGLSISGKMLEIYIPKEIN